MKVELRKIITALDSQALGRLANMSLPIKTSFRVRKIVEECNRIAMRYEDTRRAFFIEKHGATLNEQQHKYDFPSPEIERQALIESDELLNEVVDLAIEPLGLSSFSSSNVITPIDLMALEWLIAPTAPIQDVPVQSEMPA